MKKIICIILLALNLMFIFNGSANANEDYAEKLKNLGVFKGTDKGFELDREPTRLEGLIIMLRLLGEEENAKQFTVAEEHFVDLPEWGKPYVYYAYNKGITKGVSGDHFAPEIKLQSNGFLTYVLRALGYKEGAEEAADFVWSQPELFAMSQNLVNESQLSNWSINPFYREDAVRVAYSALQTKTKTGVLLAEQLIDKGVFSREKVILAGIALPDKTMDKNNKPLKQGDNNTKVVFVSDIIANGITNQYNSNIVIPNVDNKFQGSNLEQPEPIKPEFPDEKPYPLVAEATATKDQVYRWAKTKGMSEEGLGLIDLYYEICSKKGLNPVIQYAQMCHETGFLYKISSMAGMDASYHNPCGLKVTEGGNGFVAQSHKRFKDWREGIEAHTDHTALYAGVDGYPKFDSPDPRHFPFLKGQATMLSDLSGPGKWAPSWYYHRKIYNMLQEIENM